MTQQPNEYKEVKFDEYCDHCMYSDLPEDSDVCNECLTNPVNLYSHKPVKYEEGEKKCRKSDYSQSDSSSELP